MAKLNGTKPPPKTVKPKINFKGRPKIKSPITVVDSGGNETFIEGAIDVK